MSNKISWDSVINAMNLAGIEGEVRKTLLKKLEMLAEEEKAEKPEKGKKKKNQLIVVLKTADNIDVDNIAATVFQMPEDADPNTLMPLLKKCAVDQNLGTKSKKKFILKTFTDVISFCKNRWTKGDSIKILTKDYVGVQVITPEQDSSFISPQIAE